MRLPFTNIFYLCRIFKNYELVTVYFPKSNYSVPNFINISIVKNTMKIARQSMKILLFSSIIEMVMSKVYFKVTNSLHLM